MVKQDFNSEALEWPILDLQTEDGPGQGEMPDLAAEGIPGSPNSGSDLPAFPEITDSLMETPEYPETPSYTNSPPTFPDREVQEWELPEMPQIESDESPRPDKQVFPSISQESPTFSDQEEFPDQESPVFPETPEVNEGDESTSKTLAGLVAVLDKIKPTTQEYGGRREQEFPLPIEAIEMGSWKQPSILPANFFPASPSIR